MTFAELHQRYLATCDALNAHPTGEGAVQEAWHRATHRLFRPPVLRTKDDALAVLAFIEEEMSDVGSLLDRLA
jgi:hypothetical protein